MTLNKIFHTNTGTIELEKVIKFTKSKTESSNDQWEIIQIDSRGVFQDTIFADIKSSEDSFYVYKDDLYKTAKLFKEPKLEVKKNNLIFSEDKLNVAVRLVKSEDEFTIQDDIIDKHLNEGFTFQNFSEETIKAILQAEKFVGEKDMQAYVSLANGVIHGTNSFKIFESANGSTLPFNILLPKDIVKIFPKANLIGMSESNKSPILANESKKVLVKTMQGEFPIEKIKAIFESTLAKSNIIEFDHKELVNIFRQAQSLGHNTVIINDKKIKGSTEDVPAYEAEINLSGFKGENKFTIALMLDSCIEGKMFSFDQGVGFFNDETKLRTITMKLRD